MDINALSSGQRDVFDDPVGIGDDGAEKAVKVDKGDFVHIRVQQRNGRKCITTVQGLHKDLDLKKILKVMKKEKCCNGNVVEDDEMGQVLQLQGDQRDAMVSFLLDNGALSRISAADRPVWHAFGRGVVEFARVCVGGGGYVPSRPCLAAYLAADQRISNPA